MKITQKRKMQLSAGVLFFVFLLPALFSSYGSVYGEDDLDDQLEQTLEEIEQTEEEKEKAREELEKIKEEEQQLSGSLNYYEYQLGVAQQQLVRVQEEIADRNAQIEEKLGDIASKESLLEEQKSRLSLQIRRLYKSMVSEPATVILFADGPEDAELAIYYQAVVENLRRQVFELGEDLNTLIEEKDGLEQEIEVLRRDKDSLSQEKTSAELNINTVQKRVLAAQSEQNYLSQELAGLDNKLQELTKKEKEILSRKAAAALASTSVGEIEIRREAVSSSPVEGEISFSFWSYGYPHRVGMNQYGAYGRAKSGQGYREILSAYYQNTTLEDKEVPEKITILDDGKTREIDFEEDYLMGIGEMPSCWGTAESGGYEALKAQVVAARTYALKYTNWGSSPICISQSCQVYVGSSKVNGVCGQYWEQAVLETRGQVLISGGEPISAWYSSTSGGFTLDSADVWGSVRSYALGIKDADSQGQSYDGPSWGNSPWYHKCWGDEPWLNRATVEDLLNAALLPESYNAFLPSEINGGFSAQEVLTVLRDEGITPIINLQSLEVIGAETAQTLIVRAYYEDTYVDLDAQRFRFAFNLRSPGTDALWSSRFDIVSSLNW